MEREFKIDLPELKVNKEQKEQEIRAKFKEDFNKGGNLTQVFIFTYLNQPASVTEITDSMSKYYQKEFERTAVFRVLNRLVKLGLIHTTTSGMVVHTPNNERKDVHNLIITKFKRFLEGIPEPFKKRYTDVNYFWLANGEGMNHLDWCCRILGFKCEEVNKNEILPYPKG
jgi:hypothetical protein